MNQNKTIIIFSVILTFLPLAFLFAQSDLLVNIQVTPDSGLAPLNNVDISVQVSGSATGDITYKFDCTSDGGWEQIITSASTNYTAVDLCSYSTPGNYIANIVVIRGGLVFDSQAAIVVQQTSDSLAVTLLAIPSSGNAPLYDVDLRATVSGTATGSINYKFDCTNDGIWDYTYNAISDNPKAVVNACDYHTAGTYTAKVYVERGSALPANATTTIFVSTQPPPGSPGLSIDKFVSNVTDGTSFSQSVYAEPLDDIEFKINIASIGASIAYNVIVKDALPSNIIYKGSLKIDGVSSGGDIFTDLNLGNMTPGTSKSITFRAEVASETNFSSDRTTTVVNTASVRSNGISKIHDTAVLNVTRIAHSEMEVTIDKEAKNLTGGQTQWHEVVDAAPSDKIAFRIIVTSTSNSAISGLRVKDSLLSHFSWYGDLEIEGEISDLDIKEGIYIGDLAPGATKTITFKVFLDKAEQFAYGITELTNRAMVYNAEDALTNTAKVRVSRTKVAGEVTEIPTGILSSLITSFGVTLLLSYCLLLGFFFYQKTFAKTGISLGKEFSKAKSATQDWYTSLNMLDSQEKSAQRLAKAISEIQEKEN